MSAPLPADFHTTFPGYEQQYYREQVQAQEERRRFRKEAFCKKYPGVSWDDLTPQTPDIYTNDACVHFLHKETGIIYSYDCLKTEWFEYDKPDQDTLRYLFDEAEVKKRISEVVGGL